MEARSRLVERLGIDGFYIFDRNNFALGEEIIETFYEEGTTYREIFGVDDQ